tara:strand:- start:1310 stop:2233 length:924 start_codon:yes stop_codon:yes gene_type:complete
MKNKPTFILFSIFIILSIAIAGVKILVSNTNNLYDDSGIIFIDQKIIDRVTISNKSQSSQLYKVNNSWRIGKQEVFKPKLSLFWKAVNNIQKSELVSVNTKNFNRIGLNENESTLVQFFLESTLQEEFIVGKWEPETKTCFIKKINLDQVFGFTCPYPDIFATNPDMWRNPIIANFPADELAAIRFSYPSEQFELNLTEKGWQLNNQDNIDIDSYKIARFANITQLLLADGFLNDSESKDIDFNQSDALITLVPKPNAPSRITRLRLKQLDEKRVAVKNGNIPIIYYISISKAQEILLREKDFILQE